MDVFHHKSSLRKAIAKAKAEGKTIGFVPTMGNLHNAHLALVKQAKENADIVVASIFVNRLQFGLNEDWDKYPRTLDTDIQKLRSVECDYLFCPDEKEMYPNGMDAQTKVIVPSMANMLCGVSRPGHFDGVTTVVSKLFNIVQPNIAVFGAKDFQQLAIIRVMVEDLCNPVDILSGDIVREPDGLAMSSRNHFILDKERPKANRLNLTLNWVAEHIRAGERNFQYLEQTAREKIEKAGFRPDYVNICNSKQLAPAAHDDTDITILGAMYTQRARLIDNVSIVLSESR